jgi:chromosome segregation ATPase
MTIFDEVKVTEGECQDSRLSVWMLDQMAEGLEDQAAGLSRRAAGFEEEESLLSEEIERHETEINRLLLRLDAVRSDRDSVMERIESLKHEANGIRERLFLCEEEAAIAVIDPAGFENGMAVTNQVFRAPITRPLNAA